jgi:class 3 adenylate cyclase
METAMAELPTGTVTFLFTDIEVSTALWEWDRAAMTNAVDRHLELLRAAIEAHGGALIQVAGPSEPVRPEVAHVEHNPGE